MTIALFPRSLPFQKAFTYIDPEIVKVQQIL